jgi:PAS domain S-box-containing protein
VTIQDITGLRQAEEALRESEEQMRAVYEQAEVGINQVSLDGRYLNVNRKYCDMTGFALDELRNLTIHDLYHQDDLKKDLENTQRLLAGAIPTYTSEMRCICKNGNTLWVNLTASLVRKDGEPAYIIRVVTDFSERKRFEESLQVKQEELSAANEELQAQQEELTAANEELQAQQEELLAQQEELTAANEDLMAQQEELNTASQELKRQVDINREHARVATLARDEARRRAAELDAIIASILAGIVIYDGSGNIVRINEFARNLLGYSGNDYHNIPYQERWERLKLRNSDGNPYQMEELPIYRALQGKEVRGEEIMIARNPDHPVWISATFSPIHDPNRGLLGVILVFMDITGQKQKTEELLASERELLKVTLHSLNEGVVAAAEDGRIMFMNETAANLTGYSAGEAVGELVHKILCVLDDQTRAPLIPTTFPKIYHNAILAPRRSAEIPITMTCSPIKNKDGRAIGTVIVFADITEKQKTELELLKTEKLQSLGILAGGIAHDFNNVLAAILANVQLAMRKLEKGDDIKLFLSNTVETTHKARDLTKQLLTFSRGGAPVKKDASLIDLIKDTTEFALRGSNIKAEFSIPDDLWVSSIDEGQISQVIHNLVINAKQAMPKGGMIQITAFNLNIGEEAPESARFRPGNYVRITVKDQGVGIPRELLSKIFDPFFTTKKDGNGLGLATSYSIIDRHNGYIEVESREGVGTSFLIYLPASTDKVLEMELEREGVQEAAAAGDSLKILLMDDEENILQAVAGMLENDGHRVTVSVDGAEVIERYRQAKLSGEPFHVVIMDLTIPGGMGGQEAIAHLRDFDPQVKAIVSSGYANDQILSEYERFGFCGVVTKPYKFDELNAILKRIFGLK